MPDLTEVTISDADYYNIVWTGSEVQQFVEATGINFEEFEQKMGEDLLRGLRIIDVSSIRLRIDKDDFQIYQIEFELETHRVSFGFSLYYHNIHFFRVVSKSNATDSHWQALSKGGARAEYIDNLLGRLNDSDFGRSVVEKVQTNTV